MNGEEESRPTKLNSDDSDDDDDDDNTISIKTEADDIVVKTSS